MKEYFVVTIKGRLFKFTRISSSSFDTWYSISEMINPKEVLYRMSKTIGDSWKIKTLRLPLAIYSYESDFSDAIEKNEKDERQQGYQPSFCLSL
jgi:hypothetical protein